MFRPRSTLLVRRSQLRLSSQTMATSAWSCEPRWMTRAGIRRGGSAWLKRARHRSAQCQETPLTQASRVSALLARSTLHEPRRPTRRSSIRSAIWPGQPSRKIVIARSVRCHRPRITEIAIGRFRCSSPIRTAGLWRSQLRLRFLWSFPPSDVVRLGTGRDKVDGSVSGLFI